MIFAVFSGFIFSLIIPVFDKIPRKYLGYITSIFPLTLFIYFSSFYSYITDGKIISESYNWLPSFDITLSFYLDGLSLTFALIITLIGTVVFLYAGSYMRENKFVIRFYIYITVFMSSMLGLVTSDNLLSMFIFWEITSISSYLLIGFKHEKEKSRSSALQALLITGSGGLALLAGIILIASIGGWSISNLSELNETITSHSLYPPAAILILLGAFTKSAQYPFHFWLPNAMEAPTPVSAYLHSATMVKAGIYLLARLNPAMGGTVLWQNTILIVGTITMVFAAILALKQTDLKKLLAYSTLSVLGTLTMLLGIGSELAIKAFMIYLIAHSLYKGTLFLVAGILDHETGTRDISVLSGLRKMMPFTAAIAIVASLSKMGIIPLIGFVGKETVYASILEFPAFGSYLIVLAILANVFIVYITLTVGFKPFFGQVYETPKIPHEAPFKMWFGPAILALLGLILGVFSSIFVNKLINFSEIGIINEKLNIPVKLWHGFNLEFGLSTLTVILGILLYLKREEIINFTSKFSFSKYLRPSHYYQSIVDNVIKFAGLQTSVIQNGYLRNYLLIIILFTIFVLGPSLLSVFNYDSINVDFNVSFYEIIIALLMLTSTAVAVHSKSRLTAIISVGVVGYCVALIFILYSAPDLAMTQFAIETLTVILFVLIIYRLPKYLPFSNYRRKSRDLIIAALGGLSISIFTLIVISGNIESDLKNYFAENSWIVAKGKNIVNVILVDFRALDTMGEMTVLAVAAIGVFTLLKLKKGNKL